MLYQLSYTAKVSVAGIEPASSRSPGEVTVVFTTGQLNFSKLAGGPATRLEARFLKVPSTLGLHPLPDLLNLDWDAAESRTSLFSVTPN